MNNIVLKDYEIDLLYDNMINIWESDTEESRATAGLVLATALDTILTCRHFEQCNREDVLREVLHISKERYCDE